MAITSFQLLDNQTFTTSDVSNGVLFTSPDQSRGLGDDLSTGVHIIVDYDNLQSSTPVAALRAVVEGKSAQGQFYTMAYQFEEFEITGSRQRRQIVMSQDLNHQTVDDKVSVNGLIVDQISRQNGIMPYIWRVRVNIRDSGSDFISVKMSIYGERFNSFAISKDVGSVVTDLTGALLTDAGSAITA